MDKILASQDWMDSFPGGQIGLLRVGGLDNTVKAPGLQAHKRELEARLREEYGDLSRAELLELPVLQAYKSYYRAFNKTYHVQLQLESVVFKGKHLPQVSPLVDAVFAAELDTLILTAGHDADRLMPPVQIDVTRAGESYTGLGGRLRRPKPGDMAMRDGRGLVCTILYGQDEHTPITSQTQRVLYVAYVPAGIPTTLVENHLDRIEANLRLFAPQAEVEYREVLKADKAKI